MSSSEDFFNQSMPGQTANLKSRKSRAPPPPPKPSSTASSSYYGTNQRPAAAATAPPPPPRRASAHQQQSTTRTSAATATKTTSHATAPSFYGSAGGYSASSSAAPAASSVAPSYYGTPAPAAYASSSTANDGGMTQTTSSNTAAKSTSDGGWYSAPVPAAPAPSAQTNTDWYNTTPQQQQQPQQFVQQPTDFTQQQQQPAPKSSELAGAMDATPFYPSNNTNISTFTPTPATMQSSSNIYENDFSDEPPLLEELGINMQHIYVKTKAVVLPFSRFGVDTQAIMHEDDDDLAGPLVFALLLGGELLLSGKLQFSYIYGFGVFGCLSMTLVLNLMSPVNAVSIWSVASILGYALLPVNILAVCKIGIVSLLKLETMGALLAVLTIAWCTVASTRLLEQKCGMRDQRYLVAYPIALLYSAFVMITIF